MDRVRHVVILTDANKLLDGPWIREVGLLFGLEDHQLDVVNAPGKPSGIGDDVRRVNVRGGAKSHEITM